MKKIKNLETAGRDGLGFGFRHLKKYILLYLKYLLYILYFLNFIFCIFLIYFLKYFSTNFLNIKIFFYFCL